MRLPQDDDVVQHLSAYTADPPLSHRICQGDRYAVGEGVMPKDRITAMTASLNVLSRSKMK